MTTTLWQEADEPGTLLRLLEEQGEQRRFRLLACFFFQRIFQGPARHLLLADRWTSGADGERLLHNARLLADFPDSAEVHRDLCRLRTQLAVDCQALARLLMSQTARTPPPLPPNGQPPVDLLPRLLLVALGSMLILPPSPLATASLAPDLQGEILPIEIEQLPQDHPRTFAENRILRLLVDNEPARFVRHLLEGLLVTGIGLLLSVDGRPGREPNLATILDDLRVRSPEEMGMIVQGAGEMGQPVLRELLLDWTAEADQLAQTLPVSSCPRVQAQGLIFLDAALSLLLSGNLDLSANRAAQRSQADLIRAFVGNPFESSGIDPMWMRRDDARVGRLAESIYQDENWAALPILGDALEEAGCSRQDFLDALREPVTPHRGWWLLDALRLPAEA